MGTLNKQEEISVIKIGNRLSISSTTGISTYSRDECQIQIASDGAFGDGEHPTTHLCLLAIEKHIKPGDSFFDIGTGTGILSIAAAKLGAFPILAIDIDPNAVRTARENITINLLDQKIRVVEGSLSAAKEKVISKHKYSLIAANISAQVILKLFDNDLAMAISPGGLLILAGFLPMQTPAIRARLKWNDLKIVAEERMKDWVCIIAKMAK